MRRSHFLHFLFLIILLAMVCALFLRENGHEEQQNRRLQRQLAEAKSTTSKWALPTVLSTTVSHTKYGYPVPHKVVGPYHVLVNDGYVSGYDAGIQNPLWVETRFFNVDNPSSAGRPSEFSPDDRIEPQNRVSTHLWTKSGYDRGHMAPNWGVSICYGRQAQIQTFLLTNVIPQTPALNRGLWESLEKIVSNDYAKRFGEVWVICGPVFGSNPGTLKEGKVLIPDKCYKIVLRVDSNGAPHALAFELPQELPMGHQQRDLIQYLTSIAQIEQDTAIDFFPDLPADLRTTFENNIGTRLW